MEQIVVNGTKYNVFGKGENANSKYPHIEIAATGEIPERDQKRILQTYMIENNIPIKDFYTTHECARRVLRHASQHGGC